MASKYSYKDFETAANAAGLLGQFSTADLQEAQKNPDFGMSILKYKQDYRDAKTPEARALANEGANKLRASLGEYTGGGDGGSFAMTELSPAKFEYSTPKPEYTNRYDQRTQELMDAILNRQEFSYDAEKDPLYSQYRKQYAREGSRVMDDTLGKAAAASGGLPSSYAVGAAQQAGNYYSAQMTDKIPELYKLAYDKYRAELAEKRSDVSMLQDAESIDYSKYRNDLNQWNNDRTFEYQRLQDEIDSQTREKQEARQKALDAAEVGDYRLLADMGIDTSEADWNKRYRLAALAAEMGDYSGLRALGIEPNAKALYEFNRIANARTGSTGSGSGDGYDDVDYFQQMYNAGVTTEEGAYNWLASHKISGAKDLASAYGAAYKRGDFGRSLYGIRRSDKETPEPIDADGKVRIYGLPGKYSPAEAEDMFAAGRIERFIVNGDVYYKTKEWQ